MRTTLAACAAWTVVLAAPIPAAHAHWPGQPPHQMAQLGELRLEGGGIIHNFRMSYVTHGKLNAAKDNAILFQHGFAANHHQFDHMTASPTLWPRGPKGNRGRQRPPLAPLAPHQPLPARDAAHALERGGVGP